MCRVADGILPWGDAATNFDDSDYRSHNEAEQLLADVTIEVADNLWSDALSEPWLLCPRHGDHPLQAQLFADWAGDSAFATPASWCRWVP